MKKERWFIILVTIAVLIFLSWFVYANFITKYSTIICDENMYTFAPESGESSIIARYDDGSGGWKDNVCFQDCADLCVSLGYKYKSHYSPRGVGDPNQENTCSDWGCGCKCV